MAESTQNIIEGLEALAERRRADAERELATINDAIATLRNIGEPAAEPTERHCNVGGMSVVDMAEEAAKVIGGYMTSHGQLVDKIAEAHPDKKELAKRGIYTAVAKLLKDNRWHKVPGGWASRPKPEGQSVAEVVGK